MTTIAIKYLKWIPVILLPVFLIASNLRLAVNSLWLYEYGFHRFGIASVTWLTESELSRVAGSFIDFVNLRSDTAQVVVSQGGRQFPLYSEREIVHLGDVKDLIQLDYRVQIVTLVVMAAVLLTALLLERRNAWQTVRWALMWGSYAVVALIVVLAVWALTAFDQLFILFHLVGFPNDFWILDPRQHYLIMMFPEGFFYLTVLLVLGTTLMEAAAIWLVGLRAQRIDAAIGRRSRNS